jgi:hypothetical protein
MKFIMIKILLIGKKMEKRILINNNSKEKSLKLMKNV